MIDEKKEILNLALDELKVGANDDEFKNFIRVIFDNKRLSVLNDILDCYDELVMEQRSVVNFELTVARELKDFEKSEIINKLSSIVKKEKRAEYIQSLALSHEKDVSKEFIDFMMNHHIENLKEQIKEYKTSSGLVEKTETTQVTTQATTQDLSQQDMALVELIKAKPSISKSQVAEEMGWKKDNAGYHIQKLKEKGIIKRIGTSQNGHWEVISNE